MERDYLIDKKKMTTKKCPNCGNYLTLNRYRKYSGERGSKRGIQSYRSICRECENEGNAIQAFKKELEVVMDFFNNKCEKCETSISLLPALEFHHPDPNLKEIPWNKLKKYGLEKIINTLHDENVILLCANCHIKEHSDFYNNFQDLLLKENLFQNTAEDIDEMINIYLNYDLNSRNANPSYRAKIKYNIKYWMRKRYIVESLYNGKCIGCNDINVMNNLPCFGIHHKDPTIINTKSSWEELKKLPAKKISDILKKENSIFICANCHTLIHQSYFIKNIYEIFGVNLIEFANYAINIYRTINENVNNYRSNYNEIHSPLEPKYGYGKGWKYYLIHIYNVCINKGLNEFNTNELASSLNISQKGVNQYLPILINKNLIELIQDETPIWQGNLIIGHVPRIYKLTDIGFQKARNIID